MVERAANLTRFATARRARVNRRGGRTNLPLMYARMTDAVDADRAG